ncbi:hypothetical protein MMPV_007814 [Pyropia vietnamensis]
MLHAGRSGFLHARATQAFLIAVVATTLGPPLFASRPGTLPPVPLRFPPTPLLVALAVTHGLTFTTPASLVAGCLFLYGTRHVERLASTGVHARRLTAAVALYAAYTLLAGAAGVTILSGPWGVMGVLGLDTAIEVPPLSGGATPGVGVGDTGVMVGLATLALLSGGRGGGAAALGALLVGVILRLGRGGSALRTPPRVPPLDGETSSRRGAVGTADAAGDTAAAAASDGPGLVGRSSVSNGRHGRGDGEYGGAELEEPAVGDEEEEPADEGVAALAAMGFSVERSREALAAAGGDPQTAAEMLLAGG